MSSPTMPGRVLPSSTDPVWSDPATFAEIAYWADTVCPAAHALAHPNPVQGCPDCPAVPVCDWCGLPPDVCADVVGHRRLWASGEASLLEVSR